MITTLCEHCVFAKRDNKIQYGCEFDRLLQLPHHVDGDSYVIDGYCSTCRNIYWSNNESISVMKSRAINEVTSSYSLVVNCENSDITNILNSLRQIGLSQNPHIKRPDKVYFLCDNYESYNSIKNNITGFTNYFVTQYFDILNNVIANTVKNIDSHYVVFANNDSVIHETEILDVIMSSVIKSRPIIMHQNTDYCCIITKLYMQYAYYDNPWDKINEVLNGRRCDS